MDNCTESTKTCISCGEKKSVSEFHRCAARKDGLNPYCKVCGCQKSSSNYRARREHYLALNKRYRELYPERCKRDNEQRRAGWLKRRFSITKSQYDQMLVRQDGVCAVCRQAEERLVPSSGRPKALSVDHDHSCCPGDRSCGKCVRGLLCHSCNLAIGKFRDDPDLLRKAADYIGSFRVSAAM